VDSYAAAGGPDLPPLCPECVRASGLCASHAKGVLPQLAQPFWYQLVGTDHRHEEQRVQDEMSPEARKVYNRKRTRAARRAVMQTARARALNSLVPPCDSQAA
jgi:hypothetical protein